MAKNFVINTLWNQLQKEKNNTNNLVYNGNEIFCYSFR